VIAGNHPKQRGLAGPIATDQANTRTRWDLGGGVLKDEAAADTYGEIVEGQHGDVLIERSGVDKSWQCRLRYSCAGSGEQTQARGPLHGQELRDY
jgi:hypothetical protein